MLDIGWTELLLIAFIAIAVVGPKDLPKLMAKVGRWTRAAQRAAREFQTSLEQMAEEVDTKEVTRDLRALSQQARDAFSDKPRPAAIGDAAVPSQPPPLSQLPPEGGSFRPPAEEDETLALADTPAAKNGSGT